ncbi:rhomboid family intramembrane serine protease [Roseovarius sp. CAU 1744]|uniref:rhomboid family intramembrane serine protease n=1 Tax=Roseovarius sp. CAU 1744 TaxID=3140368 RepID=UPI00325AA645
MIPIRDHNPSGRTPYVTYALIAVNVVIFLGYWPLFSDPRAINAFFDGWAMIPVRVSAQGDYAGLVTSMFLHGSVMHLGGNMLFLWIFGDNVEEEMGHVPFLLFYLAAGIGAGIVHVLSSPASLVPTVGASGAIAAVMGSYLLLFPRAKVDIFLFFVFFLRILPIPAWIMLGIWFALQLVNGVGSDPSAGGVAYWAHAGGFVIGIGATLPLFLRLGGQRFWARTDGHPPHPEADYRIGRSRIPVVKRRK